MPNKLILVGDNPFHGVSHVSRERSLLRDGNILNAKHDAKLVLTSVNNGANGFTFTVSEKTLAGFKRGRRGRGCGRDAEPGPGGDGI